MHVDPLNPFNEFARSRVKIIDTLVHYSRLNFPTIIVPIILGNQQYYLLSIHNKNDDK